MVCALLALEKYLCEMIDDGGELELLLGNLLDQGSIPITGVLTAIGLYKPALIGTALAPMLSVAELPVVTQIA